MNNIKTPTHVYFLSSYLSQWYPARFVYDGVLYTSAEQYMMAQKALLFGDEVTYKKIMVSTSPSEAKKLGKEVANFDNDIWDKNKYDIVTSGNFLKFTQNTELMSKLIFDFADGAPTGREFVECNPRDKIWGIGRGLHEEEIYDITKWNGENLLGDILTCLASTLSCNLYRVQ